MTTKRRDSRSDDHNDNEDEWFEPLARDEADFAWYFAQGPVAPKWSTPATRKRRSRIERRLDGGGFALMLLYTARPSRSASSGVIVAAFADYRRYLQDFAKPRSERPPYLIVNSKKIRALVLRSRSGFETVSAENTAGAECLRQVFDGGVTGLEALLEDVERSTWGGYRVDVESARLILELAFGVSFVRARHLGARALGELANKLAAVPDVPAVPQPVREPDLSPEQTAEGRRLDLAALVKLRSDEMTPGHRVRSHLEWCGAVGQSLTPGVYDHRKSEQNVGRPTTTVTEISERTKLGTRWVRAELAKPSYCCPGLRLKDSAIPTEWLNSDRGKDFWAAATAERERRDRKRDAESLNSRRNARFGVRRRRA